ncbi:MAG TPA: hypothetical protein ENJ95_06545 [Bacteroidetes bacterium]|nr:hypothetical protein [Bacteroidota bacterium]
MKYIFPIFLSLFFACKNQPKNKPVAEEKLPEGFPAFYQRFHSDSLYQINHIIFPLQGIPNNADRSALTDDTFRWKKEDWQMMHPIDFQMSEYQRILTPLTDQMVVEHIVHKNGQYGMLRRFAIIGDDWHLIYYAGMNRLAQ